MGTRHLIVVVLDGKFKVAQYAQWDGYPSGQGALALHFLRDRVEKGELDTFKAKVAGCTFVSKDKVEELWDEYKHVWTRDNGATILRLVHDSASGLLLNDSSEFAADSLFCEWAYVIDLDKSTFEVFKGFNQEPLDPSERFAKMRVDQVATSDYKYQPIKLVKAYSFDQLPTADQLCDECNPQEDDE